MTTSISRPRAATPSWFRRSVIYCIDVSTFYDANGDGKVWVRSVGVVQCHVVSVITLVSRQLIALSFPRDAVSGNWFKVTNKGNKKIVLNLQDVNYIDSSGIGELVSAFTTTKNQGGELKLLNLTKKVNDLLQITKLYTVFDVKDDEASAVKSFK